MRKREWLSEPCISSIKLMEKLPAKCLCGHKVGDGTHLLVCKRVNAGQIAAHDVAVRMIGAELNSYGVVVKYEQRANHVAELINGIVRIPREPTWRHGLTEGRWR